MSTDRHPTESRTGRIAPSVPGRRRQRGAETVEMIVTLLLFLTVFFMIVDFAIAVYDKGAVVNASRVGARQGSLYWVDPAAYDITAPQNNVRLKESMIRTAVDFFLDNTLVNTGNTTPTREFSVNGDSLDPNEVFFPVGNAEVRVDLAYDHSYIGLTGLLGVPNMTLPALTGTLVEFEL